ncbi:MAG: hypothetical protein NC124_19695 [Clostridium sp.]|nr:hypothetical protein [Clostridium sp.]
MYSVQNIIQGMEEKCQVFLEEDENVRNVFKKLWKERDISEDSDEEVLLKQLVFNIVWASMIVKEDADTVEEYGMRIRKMLWEYERSKERLCVCYSDNDMKLIASMIDEINACKDKMCSVKEMIFFVKEMYLMYSKRNQGMVYVFGNLWEAYETYYCSEEEDMLQTLVYDIIIASMNLQEEVLTSSQKFCIRETIITYAKYKEKIYMYYDDNDMKLIESMIDQINACKEKWEK